MQRIFQQSYHVPGTLTANLNIRFVVPCDCQLLHASVATTNSNTGTITLGDASDADEYLTVQNLPDNAVAEFDGDDFVDADGAAHSRYYPHIAGGTTVVATIAHGSAANLTLVLTFSEG